MVVVRGTTTNLLYFLGYPQLSAAASGIGTDFMSSGDNWFFSDTFESFFMMALADGKTRRAEAVARGETKKIFDNTVFQTMEGDDCQPATGLQDAYTLR